MVATDLEKTLDLEKKANKIGQETFLNQNNEIVYKIQINKIIIIKVVQ